MDCQKTGELILSLRKEKGMTQKQLADILNISDKTISKWERGLGCPDVSLLNSLANALGVDIEKILSGELNQNEIDGGNMKKIKFYVCKDCGNVVTSTGEASVSCCGRKIDELVPAKSNEAHQLKHELIEDEIFISSEHEATKEHYISFVAYVTGEKLLLVKLYPEWNIQVRFPKFKHGMIYFYCTNHGLFRQII